MRDPESAGMAESASHLKSQMQVRAIKIWIPAIASAVVLAAMASSALAADSMVAKPPVVVPRDKANQELLRDLKNASPEVKKLVQTFDTTRDKYLAEQRTLLARMQTATPEERDRIRQDLQANRDAFMADLKSFREDLRKDLQDLKRKTSPALDRVFDKGVSPMDKGLSPLDDHRRKGKN
jgi:hypothetical protein